MLRARWKLYAHIEGASQCPSVAPSGKLDMDWRQFLGLRFGFAWGRRAAVLRFLTLAKEALSIDRY